MTDLTPNFSDIYPWITKEFFENILRNDQNNNNIKVEKISIKAALGKGENFTSQMLRVKAVYSAINAENQEHSFIVKTTIPDPAIDAIINEMGLFDVESLVYKDILPQLEKLLQSIGDHTRLSAK